MKILARYILTKLCLIYLCYCYEFKNPCKGRPWTINIISNLEHGKLSQSEDKAVEQKISKFQNTIQDIFKIPVHYNRTPDDNLMLNRSQPYYVMTRATFRTVTIIIILDAKDFYKTDHRVITDFLYNDTGFKQIGTITYNKCGGKYYKSLCETIPNYYNMTPMQLKCLESHDKVPQDSNCEITEKQYMILLVSDNVVDYPSLHDLIINYNESINYNNKNVEVCPADKTVYVCLEDKQEQNDIITKFLSFSIDVKFECNKFNTDFSSVAVIAPSPKSISRYVNDINEVTTIFTDDHYTTSVSEDRTAEVFPNSFYWMSMEKTIYAILTFLESNNWNRVAIISDDTPSSQEYEKLIVALLEKRNIIYVSRSCDVENCDFVQILTPLVEAEAKFVIANIEENYNNFASQVKQWQQLVWICKSPSLAEELAREYLHNVYATTMAAYPFNHGYVIRNYSPVLDIISRLWIKKPFNHRQIAAQIKDQLYHKTTIKIYINKYGPWKKVLRVASMDITPSNQIQNYDNPGLYQDISDDLSGCTIKSSVYFKPCYDMEFIYIMLVISVFLLMVLAIVHFFKSTEISYSRMLN